MKKLTPLSVLVLLLLLVFQISEVQSQQGYYMHIDYVQIDKDDVRTFESNISSILKPAQEARVDAYSMEGWYIYRVVYPGTQNPVYNYTVVSVSTDLQDFNNARQQVFDQINQTSGGQESVDFQNMLIPFRSELWRINNSVLTSDTTKNSKYFIMDYMDVTPGMEYAYQMMEDEIALPIHQYRMEINQMNGWELFSLIAPGGTEYGYSYATGNYFSDLTNFEFGFTEEIIRQSHPETDINEINQNIDQTRDLVRSEVWELMDFVD